MITTSATVSERRAIAVGENSTAARNAVAIGLTASAAHEDSVAIGYSAASTKVDQVVLGSAAFHAEVNIPMLTASNSKDTGALVIEGGVGADGNIALGGHFISNAASVPTVGLHASHTAGTGASVTASNQTDVAGKISLTTGTGSGAGNLATVTFASAYQVAPVVILTATDANAAAMRIYVTGVTTTNFTLAVANVPSDSTTYSWNYQVIETQ
jgi:hypothetical protein